MVYAKLGFSSIFQYKTRNSVDKFSNLAVEYTKSYTFRGEKYNF